MQTYKRFQSPTSNSCLDTESPYNLYPKPYVTPNPLDPKAASLCFHSDMGFPGDGATVALEAEGAPKLTSQGL